MQTIILKNSLKDISNPLLIVLINIIHIIFFLPYSVIKNYFVGDDFYFLKYSHELLGSCENFLEAVFFRLFSHIYFFLVYPFFKLNPAGYHVVNFIFHIINSLLVYWLVFSLIKKKEIAFFSSLFFSLHYANTGTVFSVACIDELAATFFYLLSAGFFIKYLSSKKYRYYFISFLTFLCSFTAKETIVSLPLLIIVYDGIVSFQSKSNSSLKRLLLRNIPFLLVDAVYIFFHVTRFVSPSIADERFFRLFLKPADALNVMTTFFKIACIPFEFQPANLLFLRPGAHSVLFSVIILISIFVIVLLVKKVSYKFSLLWMFFTVFPFLTPIDAVVREKDVYIVLVGICFFLSLLIDDWFKLLKAFNREVALFFKISWILILLVSFVVSSNKRNKAWANSAEIMENARKSMRQVLPEEKLQKGVVYLLYHPSWVNRVLTFPVLCQLFLVTRDDREVDDFYFVDIDTSMPLNKAIYSLAVNVDTRQRSDRLIDDEIEGIDNVFPSNFKRYLFVYNDKNIFELTNLCFPETKVIFKVKASYAETIAIAGDFNDWNNQENMLILDRNDNTWKTELFLKPGKYAYKFIVNGTICLNNPNSEHYINHSEYGFCSALVIANYSLPINLLPTGEEDYDEKIKRCKKDLILNPRDAALHKKLGDLFYGKGFYDEAQLEYSVAEELTKKM